MQMISGAYRKVQRKNYRIWGGDKFLSDSFWWLWKLSRWLRVFSTPWGLDRWTRCPAIHKVLVGTCYAFVSWHPSLCWPSHGGELTRARSGDVLEKQREAWAEAKTQYYPFFVTYDDW